MGNFIIVCLVAFVAGTVQTVTGFGAGIIMMLVLPYAFGLVTASAMNGAIAMALNVALVISLWNHINFKKVLWPTILAIIFSGIAIKLIKYLPIATLKLCFSIFIIILAIYFNFFNKVEVKDSILPMVICSSISGFTNGLFGIGGPTMVVYYLAACSKKKEYIATIQAFFLCSSIYATVARVASGIITKNTLLPIASGIVFILLGKNVGTKIVDKIPADKMKKCIYYFLGIVGIIQLIQCF